LGGDTIVVPVTPPLRSSFFCIEFDFLHIFPTANAKVNGIF
jgi:hypothetical protein